MPSSSFLGWNPMADGMRPLSGGVSVGGASGTSISDALMLVCFR